jgi:hypothetical protein
MKLQLVPATLAALASVVVADASAQPEPRALPLVQSVSPAKSHLFGLCDQKFFSSIEPDLSVCSTNRCQNQLRRVLLRSELLAKGNQLQAISDASPGKNRAIFTPGHKATYEWIYNQMKELGDYYDVSYHEFIYSTPYGNLTTSDGVYSTAAALTFSPLGSVTAPIVYVPNLGCVEVCPM